MIMSGKAASTLELQAIADICFSVVECYSTSNFFTPVHVIEPLRIQTSPECKGLIRLWIQGDHCMALVDRNKRHLIQNIADDPDILEAVNYSARLEEIAIEAVRNKGEAEKVKREVADLYRRFMGNMKLNEETGLPIA